MVLAEDKKKKTIGRAKQAKRQSSPPLSLLRLLAIFPTSPLSLLPFPPLRSLVPGYQLLYTVQSSPKLRTKLMTLLPIYFNLLCTCQIMVLRAINDVTLMPVIKDEKLKLTLVIFGYCDRLFFSFLTSNQDQKRECYLHYVFFSIELNQLKDCLQMRIFILNLIQCQITM